MNAQYETQLKYRKLDANGDMRFGMGEADLLSGLDAMRQVLRTRLAAGAGEWWEGDPGALPIFSGMLGARDTRANRELFDLLIVARIMDTVGVTGVSGVESGVQGRRYHFRCQVDTVYGRTTAEVQV